MARAIGLRRAPWLSAMQRPYGAHADSRFLHSALRALRAYARQRAKHYGREKDSMNVVCVGDRVVWCGHVGTVIAIMFPRMAPPHQFLVEFEDGARSRVNTTAIRKAEAA